MYGMTTIKAKVIDGFHRELEKGIPTKTGDEVFFKNRVSKSEGLSYTFDENARSIFMQNHREKPVASLRGAWGCDVDSARFVDTLRRTIEPL